MTAGSLADVAAAPSLAALAGSCRRRARARRPRARGPPARDRAGAGAPGVDSARVRRPRRRAGLLPALACLCIALAGCGGSRDASTRARAPVPAPEVGLSAARPPRWAEGTAAAHVIPMLVSRLSRRRPSRAEMTLLDRAGYDTVALDDLVRFVGAGPVRLPPRPVLVTFDGGRLGQWTGTDSILRELGFGAVVFVDVGPVEAGKPGVPDLRRARPPAGRRPLGRPARVGHGQPADPLPGPAPGDVGAFYAFRGTEEVLGGWRERVFSDITYGEDQLTHHAPRLPPARVRAAPRRLRPGPHRRPPHPAATARAPRAELRRDLHADSDGFAAPGAPNPLGCFEVTAATTDEQLRAMLAAGLPVGLR